MLQSLHRTSSYASTHTALETYDEVGEPRPSEERLTVEYIFKLDTARFGGMRADLENQRALRPKRDLTPKTVAAAHELASSWKIPFYKDAQGVEHPVFYSEEEKTFKSPSKPPAGAGGKEMGDKKEKETEREKESGAKGRGANPKEKEKKPKGKEVSCFICSSKDHLMKDCPFVSEAKALAKETLSTPALVYNGDASTLVLAFKSLSINFIGFDSMSGAHVFHNAALLMTFRIVLLLSNFEALVEPLLRARKDLSTGMARLFESISRRSHQQICSLMHYFARRLTASSMTSK